MSWLRVHIARFIFVLHKKKYHIEQIRVETLRTLTTGPTARNIPIFNIYQGFIQWGGGGGGGGSSPTNTKASPPK